MGPPFFATGSADVGEGGGGQGGWGEGGVGGGAAGCTGVREGGGGGTGGTSVKGRVGGWWRPRRLCIVLNVRSGMEIQK